MQDRTELLTTVAVALGSAGTVAEVARSLVTTLAPAFCDGCEIVLSGGDGRLWRVTEGPGPTSERERVEV
ncbi:MAG TPA: hypothetical protein VHK88_19320, partial [Aquihabitans sp.]|nr:hypothetical protein [Aquihabitans sp.]